MEHETLWVLLHDAPHWEFEIIVNIVFDGLVLGTALPFIKKHVRHHLERDKREGVE